MKLIPTTLLLIIKDNRILLAKKARGFGAGMLNGVGGKQEPGENIVQTMIRETQEEIGVTPKDYELRGLIEFFEYGKEGFEKDLMHIFVARDYEGVPIKTPEMDPLWFDVDKVPLDQMFPDDKYWLPKIINGERLLGTFVFDKDFNLLEYSMSSATQDQLDSKIKTKEVYLKVPTSEELWFRKKCMEDPNTMNYNAGYDLSFEGYHYDTGCIDFPQEKWQKWHDEKIKNNDLFFAYIVDKHTNEFIGYVNYKKQQTNHSMGIVIHSDFQGQGYMKVSLQELINHAKEHGVKELWDSVPLERTRAIECFKHLGFEIVNEFETIRFGKPQTCVNIRYII